MGKDTSVIDKEKLENIGWNTPEGVIPYVKKGGIPSAPNIPAIPVTGQSTLVTGKEVSGILHPGLNEWTPPSITPTPDILPTSGIPSKSLVTKQQEADKKAIDGMPDYSSRTQTVVGSSLPDYSARNNAPLTGVDKFNEMVRTGVLQRVPEFREMNAPQLRSGRNWLTGLVNHANWVGNISNIKQRNAQIMDFLANEIKEKGAISKMELEKAQGEHFVTASEIAKSKLPSDIASTEAGALANYSQAEKLKKETEEFGIKDKEKLTEERRNHVQTLMSKAFELYKPDEMNVTKEDLILNPKMTPELKAKKLQYDFFVANGIAKYIDMKDKETGKIKKFVIIQETGHYEEVTW